MLKGEEGFTLIELIAVLVMVGVMSAVIYQKIDGIDREAEQVALNAGVSELNGRERLQYLYEQIGDGYPGDPVLFGRISRDLGTHYSWDSLAITGGTLRFKESIKTLVRTASTATDYGGWK